MFGLLQRFKEPRNLTAFAVILFCLNLRSTTYYTSVKKLLVGLFLFIIAYSASAQDSTRTSSSRQSKSDRKAEKRERINAISRQEEEGNLSFRKQSAFGLELRTN